MAGLVLTGLLILLALANPFGASVEDRDLASSPQITSLTVEPRSPALANPLQVTVGVEGAADVHVATFFMCIIAPKSLCYLPEEMTRTGASFTFTTRPPGVMGILAGLGSIQIAIIASLLASVMIAVSVLMVAARRKQARQSRGRFQP